MSSNLLSLDATLIEQANSLLEIPESSHSRLMNWSFDVLEGQDVTDQVREFASSININPSKLSKVCTAIGALFWECSKFIIKDIATLPEILLQLGMNETVVKTFVQCFKDGRLRLKALKGPLSLDTMSYKDFQWRLDIELSKRSIQSVTEPTYQIRLDLINNTISTAGGIIATEDEDSVEKVEKLKEEGTKTYHLQADYANLKLMQTELQRVIDEHSGVHSQRISRYIS